MIKITALVPGGLRYKLAPEPHQNKTMVELNDEWKLSTMPAERVRAALKRKNKPGKVEADMTPDEVMANIVNGTIKSDALIVNFLRNSDKSLSKAELSEACILSYGGISAAVNRLCERGVLVKAELRRIDGSQTSSKTYRLDNIFKDAA